MKKFITKYWNKILIGMGIVAIVYTFFLKITTKKTLLSDYIRYGKEVKPFNSQIANAAKDEVSSVFGSMDPELVKLTFILMAAILIIVFLSLLAAKAGEKKDAKKK